jgi:hypothetical protein
VTVTAKTTYRLFPVVEGSGEMKIIALLRLPRTARRGSTYQAASLGQSHDRVGEIVHLFAEQQSVIF